MTIYAARRDAAWIVITRIAVIENDSYKERCCQERCCQERCCMNCDHQDRSYQDRSYQDSGYHVQDFVFIGCLGVILSYK